MQFIKNNKSRSSVSEAEKPFDLALHYCFFGDAYLAMGKFDNAQKAYDQALKHGEEIKQKDPNNASFVPNGVYSFVGNFYFHQGNYEKAKQYLQESLESAVRGNAQSHVIAQIKNKLGAIYYCTGDDQSAEKLFQDAAGKNNKALISFEKDLAQSLVMLGRIEEHRGASDKALNAYQSGLNVLQGRFSMNSRVEQADVYNQLGRFSLSQGKHVEAAQAYGEAVQLRLVTQGQWHPDYSDSLRGLANVAAFENNLTSATLQATRALAILDKAGRPDPPAHRSRVGGAGLD